jgi:flagellar motor switch protein FliN
MAVDDGPVNQDEIEQLLAQSSQPAQPAKPAKPAEDGPGDSDKLLAQDDIEKLLSQAGKSAPAEAAPRPARPDGAQTVARSSVAVGPSNEGVMAQGDVDYLLNQAQEALDSVVRGTDEKMPPGVAPFRLEQFSGATPSTEVATLDLLRDVDLDLRIELGRTHMYLEEVLKLHRGSVVPLDKLAGDPVDIYVNGRLIARGEVLVLNDNFCVRVAELVAGADAA